MTSVVIAVFAATSPILACNGLAVTNWKAAWCQNGITSGNTCCAASCGICGGSGCSEFLGGASQCCAASITSECASKAHVACRFPSFQALVDKVVAPLRRRRLLLWHAPSYEFMYDPIMSSLKKAASQTLDDGVWEITQRIGDPCDEAAVRELQSLECGDVVVWIGLAGSLMGKSHWATGKLEDGNIGRAMLDVAEHMGARGLKNRGITTVYYNTEPLADTVGQTCDILRDYYSEYWDYSRTNMDFAFKSCSEGDRPVARYVPPGPLDVLTVRRNDIINECASGVGFLGMPHHFQGHRSDYLFQFQTGLHSRYPNFTQVELGAAFDYDAYGNVIKQACTQLSIHRYGKQGQAFEAVRGAPMLSGGALMLAESCGLEDEAEWRGIVDFAQSPEDLVLKAAALLQSSSEERKALARKKAKLFDERFDPATLWWKANIMDDWRTAMNASSVPQCQ